MSKYDVDLDYAILDIDISIEEFKEIIDEADKIISENKESNESLAIAYLKKAHGLRKLYSGHTCGFIFYEEMGIFLQEDDAKELLEKALELSPDMPEALVQLGLNNYHYNCWDIKDNKYEEAINLISRAIQIKPDYAAAFNNRAMLFYDLMYYYESSSIDKQKDKDNFEKAKINYRNAVADLTEAIRIQPFDALYHLNRGKFHSILGEYKEAVEDFTNAINFASDVLKDKLKTVVHIYTLRGKEYMELKEYGKAIEDFSESLRLTQYDDDTLLLRGKAYYYSGEKDKTKAVFEEYLNRKYKDADTASRKKIYECTGLRPEDI
jgi:tetratricopeptide (TPR) repeat protein